jgi:cytochrome c oxidase subunit 3
MATHEHYYVPAQSKWPIIATVGMVTTVYGLATWFNDLKAARPESHGPLIFFVGGLLVAYMLFGWFGTVIKESRSGVVQCTDGSIVPLGHELVHLLGGDVLHRPSSARCFMSAIFPARRLEVKAPKGIAHMLWPNFQFTWPLLNTSGLRNCSRRPKTSSARGVCRCSIPCLLVSSSVTMTIAHHALKKGHRGALKIWLALTVLLGCAFLSFQAEEYIHAYHELGLTLGSGIYGATFFMLTGFHGAHVTIGTIILFVMLMRIMRGHFDNDHQFGFEAASWYWHFVDVVWIGLFVFVYVL